MRRIAKLRTILLLLAMAPLCAAHVLSVPGDYATIQAAIDASADGDIVLIGSGAYTGDGNRDIDFKGKAITVRSETGPETCIIDCNGTWEDCHRGFLFRSGETTDSVLQGISIRNGYSDKGGAIFCEASSPTIRDCAITRCTVFAIPDGGLGAGIYCLQSTAVIRDCVFSENIAGRIKGSGTNGMKISVSHFETWG